jgi:hypothetical protein
MVPCIRIDNELRRGTYRTLNCMSWVPVWPIDHDDADIGFPERHYHIDWRFVSDEDLRCIFGVARGSQSSKLAITDILEHVILLVITTDAVRAGPMERLQICRRDRLTWPGCHRAPERLEPKHKDAKLRCGRCPHWGFDLRTVKPDSNGIIQCPGHGLCFRADTGEIAPRKGVKHD